MTLSSCSRGQRPLMFPGLQRHYHPLPPSLLAFPLGFLLSPCQTCLPGLLLGPQSLDLVLTLNPDALLLRS